LFIQISHPQFQKTFGVVM